MKEKKNIVYYWNKFISYIVSHGVSTEELGFNPGTTQNKVSVIEKQLGVQLPEDYKKLLYMCNGQQPSKYTVIFNWLPTENRLLSIEEVLEEWKDQQKHNDDLFFNEYNDDDKIRGVFTHKKRIPIADQYSTKSRIYIDYIPGPEGTKCQIIGLEDIQMVVLSKDLTTLLKKYLILIDKGVMKFRKSDEKWCHSYQLYFPRGRYFDLDSVSKRLREYFLE